MKTALLCIGLLFVATPALAHKSCDELKTEISTKLDAKKVSGYTLEVVAKDQAGTAKVVGSCDGGSKNIVYAKAAKKK